MTAEDYPLADMMNQYPKIIFSRTLKLAPWGKWNNARVVTDQIAGEIRKLKQQSGGNLVMFGYAGIAQTFTNFALIDGYRMLVESVILGNGKPLFKNIKDRLNLNLVSNKVYQNGIVALNYQPQELKENKHE